MSLDDLLAEDAANRERALAFDSFIVEAPAGAGKTELLTQRYLRLLAEVEEPEEIVAITFTNKAAGEMRERIAQALALARRGERPPEAHKQRTFELATRALARDAERGWQIERQGARLRLTTIDALCASLARQLPLLSRFGAQPAIADEARRHYLAAAQRTLAHLDAAGASEDGNPATTALAVVLAHLDNDGQRLTRLLADMLARREQWRALWRAGLDHPEAAIAEALATMVRLALQREAAHLPAQWQQVLMPLARFAAEQRGGGALRDWQTPLATEPAALAQWRALADLLLTGEGEPRQRLDVRQGFPKEEKARKAALLAQIEALGGEQIAALRALRQLPEADATDAELVRALVTVLKLAAAELWLVFREQGEVDFTELALRAIDALEESLSDGGDGDQADVAPSAPSELALRLDYRLRHLLVDEFQDTSPTQIRLLEALTAGWQADDGRTLFLVGDPMQSIYRFRKADVGLFLQVTAQGIGGLALTPLRLSRNNRSDPAVVAWINDAFPALFPAADDAIGGEIRYRPFVATRAPLADAGVQVHALRLPEVGAGGTANGEAAAIEAQRLIAIIESEWRADPTRTIAVLVRARDHLQGLVAALRRHPAGWRFAAVEVEPLLGRQAVQDLIALSCALHHRADRVNWLAVLRAPWCGLTLADLHALAADDHVATVWHLMSDAERLARLSADGRRRLAHVQGVIAEAWRGQGRVARRRWIEDVWRKLGGESALDAAGRADADAFFIRLDELDAAGRFVADTLAADMSALFAASDAQADGRLQLMTIHKSKGLEFDTVILPGLQRSSPPADAPLLVWDQFALPQGEVLVVAPINRRRGRAARSAELPSAYDYLRRLDAERADNEDVRVLYVAATRAIRRLHWVAVLTEQGGGELRAPRAGSALARLWPVVSAAAQAAPTLDVVSAESPAGELGDFVPELVRLADPVVPAHWQAPPSLITETADDDTGDRFAAAVGTLVHACLEQAALSKAGWEAAAMPARQPALARWLRAQGWNEAQAHAGAERAVRLLATTLASKDGRWVLAQHEDGAAELVLGEVDASAQVGAGGTAMLGATAPTVRVIDRCFIADGVRWIVDYKTADLGAAPGVEALTAHAERYRAQLDGYARLFGDEGLPVRRAVLYVAYGKLVTLD